MNSLTAFKKIMEKYGKTNTLEGTYDYFLAIKKDLEVLEILKDLINDLDETIITEKISNCVKVGYSNIKEYFIINDFTGKVKEWLENEEQ